MGAFTCIQVFIHITSRYETTICESHKELLRARIARCAVAHCPATAPTVQSIFLLNCLLFILIFNQHNVIMCSKKIVSCVVCAFTNIQFHMHMTPRHETTICGSHKELLHAEIELFTRYTAASCPTTALTVQSCISVTKLLREGEIAINLIQFQIPNTTEKKTQKSKRPSNILPDPEIETETPCPVVALATIRPKRQCYIFVILLTNYKKTTITTRYKPLSSVFLTF
ncbi:hypothetical protein SFRURICE_006982 [Spodoptera frugiperda]|nr:hypothetical protein SFRURICE_006982 [Spodoptera frugiperda]